MATKVKAGEKVRRSDVFYVAPSEIKPGPLNGRTDVVSPERVAWMAADIKANGQIQPVITRKLKDHSIQVIAGYTRHAAGLLIEQSDPSFRLACAVVEADDREAFLINVRENLIRNATTPIDNAVNCKRMIDEFGEKPKAVAALFGKSEAWVNDHLMLLNLPEPVRRQVSAGNLGVRYALRLARLPNDEAAAVLAAAEAAVAADPDDEGIDETGGLRSHTLPFPGWTGNGDPADGLDAALDAVKAAPSNPKAKGQGGRPARVKAKAKAPTLNQKVSEAVRARGVNASRSASELKRFLKHREGPVSLTILSYMNGKGDERVLSRILDAADRVEFHPSLIPKPLKESKPPREAKAPKPPKAAKAGKAVKAG